MQYLVVLSSRSGPLEKEAGWVQNGVKRKGKAVTMLQASELSIINVTSLSALSLRQQIDKEGTPKDFM